MIFLETCYKETVSIGFYFGHRYLGINKYKYIYLQMEICYVLGVSRDI